MVQQMLSPFPALRRDPNPQKTRRIHASNDFRPSAKRFSSTADPPRDAFSSKQLQVAIFSRKRHRQQDAASRHMEIPWKTVHWMKDGTTSLAQRQKEPEEGQ